MIFQSNVSSTTKEGKSWGLIATIAFHALLLAIVLLIIIPAPVSHPLDPVILVNFGEPDMGGPSTEMAGGSGEELSTPNQTSAQPDVPNEQNVIDNPEASVSAKAVKSPETKPTETKPTKETVKKPVIETGSTYTKTGRTHKGTGTNNASGPGNSAGSGLGPNPGNEGDPNGVPNGMLDGNRHLKEKYRPRQLRKAEFNDDETDDPNPKKLYVIVTVTCEGVISRVRPDVNHATDTKNLKYVTSKLKGQKFFDEIPNCKEAASWPIEVLITPN